MATQRGEKRKTELDGSIRTDVANLEQHVKELDDKALTLLVFYDWVDNCCR